MVLTTPDETAIAMEREDLLKQFESLHKQIEAQDKELQIARSDINMLKDCIVKLTMQYMGIN